MSTTPTTNSTSNNVDIKYQLIHNDVNVSEHTLQVTIDNLNKDNKDKDVTIDNLNKDNKDKDVTIDNLNKDKQNLNVTIDNLNKNNKDKDVTIDNLNKDKQNLKVTIDNLNKDKQNLKVTIDNLTNKNVAKRQEITRLKRKANTLMENNREYKVELDYSKTQYNELYKSVRPSTMETQEIINVYKIDDKTYTLRKGQRSYIESFSVNANDPNQVLSFIVKNAKITSAKIRKALNQQRIAECKNIHIKISNNTVYTNNEFKKIIIDIINN
jgi:chromosome segregation ATPase